jgi:iron complex outermembrane receptor protein
MTWDKSRVLGITTDFNHVDDTMYLDGQVSYKLESLPGQPLIYLNVQNVLNRAPTYDPITGSGSLSSDPFLYDQVGRMFRLGFRARF